MHKKHRKRGKVLRYIKNPSKSFFHNSEAKSNVRIIEARQSNIKQATKSRKPKMPNETIPDANKSIDEKIKDKKK